MKKVFVLFLSLLLCAGLAGCGGGESSEESDVPKIGKTIDAAAAELELTNKQEKAFELVGATDGAGYDGGIELYLYDEDSDAYKDMIGDGYDMGIAVIKAAAHNDGMVLVYTGDDEPDQTLLDKFNALAFE